jgi:beta-glucosidase
MHDIQSTQGEAINTRTPITPKSKNNTINQKVVSILKQMTLKEKIAQMSGNAGLLDLLIMTVRYNHRSYDSGENKRLGIPPLRFTDGPRGIVLGNATCFPVTMARGATWDVELEERLFFLIWVLA